MYDLFTTVLNLLCHILIYYARRRTLSRTSFTCSSTHRLHKLHVKHLHLLNKVETRKQKLMVATEYTASSVNATVGLISVKTLDRSLVLISSTIVEMMTATSMKMMCLMNHDNQMIQLLKPIITIVTCEQHISSRNSHGLRVASTSRPGLLKY